MELIKYPTANNKRQFSQTKAWTYTKVIPEIGKNISESHAPTSIKFFQDPRGMRHKW